MNVTFFSSRAYEISNLTLANKSNHKLIFEQVLLDINSVNLSQNTDVVSIFTNDTVDADVLHRLKLNGTKHISIRAAGYNNVDLITAEKLGITVANVPEYSPYSVAEHTVALILALNRKLVQTQNRIHRYNFTLDDLQGFDLNGKTVGIIGLGKIGGVVAKILHGFGCNILGHDINPNPNLISKYNVRYCSLGDIYKQADIISMHCPLTPSTKYILNKSVFAKMKKGVMIVNTGRGGLINTEEAIEAIESGTIGYLGLDVYENEKGIFFYDHSSTGIKDETLKKLMQLNNVIVTPHMSFLTHTALKNIADTTFENINNWASDKKSPNELF